MFTGLVREVGTVASMVDGRLTISAPETAQGVQLGDSIAIDGVCLTVVAWNGASLSFDAVPETLARTALGTLEYGSRVNLEPALRAGDAGACGRHGRRTRRWCRTRSTPASA